MPAPRERIRGPSALPDSPGRTCADASRPALPRTTFPLRTPTERRKVRQLSWERSGTPGRTAAVPTLLGQPLRPQPALPPFGRPSLAHSRHGKVHFLPRPQSPLGDGRSGRLGTRSRARRAGSGRARSPGGADRRVTPLPFFSSSAPPGTQSAASSTNSAVLAVPEGRISLPSSGWLRLSGFNPTPTESHSGAR